MISKGLQQTSVFAFLRYNAVFGEEAVQQAE